jgi:hypothetical protein
VGCCCAPGWRRLGRRGHRHRTCLYHSSMETIVAFARVRWVMSAPQLTHWETRTAITWRATSARTQGFHAAQQAVRRGGAVTIRSSQQLPVAPVLCGRKVLACSSSVTVVWRGTEPFSDKVVGSCRGGICWRRRHCCYGRWSWRPITACSINRTQRRWPQRTWARTMQ